MKSVQKLLAKEAMRTVFTAKGGLKGAHSQGSLLLKRKQSYNISHNVKKVVESTIGSRSKGRDLLFLVIQQCSLVKSKTFLYKRGPVPLNQWPLLQQSSNCAIWSDSTVMQPHSLLWELTLHSPR